MAEASGSKSDDQAPAQAARQEAARARPTDPHRALKHGLRVQFARMAEREHVWLSVEAIRKPPTAGETLTIMQAASWDELAASLPGEEGHAGAKLGRGKLLLCTNRTYLFKRSEVPWPRERWLRVLQQLFSDRRQVFLVPAIYALHFPLVNRRFLTPCPWKELAPQREWDSYADDHEEVVTLPALPMRPVDFEL